MQRRVFLSMTGAAVLGGFLAGCGGFRQSRMNPGNWFTSSTARRRDSTAAADGSGNPLIPEREDSIFRRDESAPVYEGTPVDRITALSVEPTGGGAIIRVTGRTLRQGAFDVRLVPAQPGNEPVDGVLRYELRALQPGDTPQGAKRARQVHAAVFVSNQAIERTSRIRVQGARNERLSRR